MIQISDQAARAVLRLLEDVADVNRRAGCSDRYFRQHFVMLAALPAVTDAAREIAGALEAPEEPPDPFDDPDE